MNPFAEKIDRITSDFEARGIPFDAPGFCDHPRFLNAERNDVGYINTYGAFISKSTYSSEYLKRARSVIEEAALFLNEELAKNGRLGACVDISAILFRILEEERVWSCCIHGSLTVDFPSSSDLEAKYFWSIDDRDFLAGHAWLYAPPFTIVDVSARQQPYADKEANYIPSCIISESRVSADFSPGEIISPSISMQMRAHGIPETKQLQMALPQIPSIFNAFPVTMVPGINGSSLKYIPVRVSAPTGKLSDMTNMFFDGLSPQQLYKEKLLSRLRKITG